MLVLSRKQNESIVIDGSIEVQILKVKGNTIRLGIVAPKDVKILRGELAPFGKDSRFVGNDDLGNPMFEVTATPVASA